MTPARKRLRVGFLLADRFTLSAFANFVDVLRLAADEADRSRPILCDWTVLSDDMSPIRSSCGVKVQPDTRLDRAGTYDYLVVVGGLIREASGLSPASMQFLQAAARGGVPLVGLCTGVFLLHEAGLLDGYRCCVSWFHHDDFLERFGSTRPVSDQIFVVDRDRLTCSGGHSAAHLAAWLVETHIGRVAAIKSLSILIIDEAMTGDKPQPGGGSPLTARDPLVRKALIRMRQRLEDPATVDELAADLGVGRRKLERSFQADLGLSPARAGQRLRLDAARHLLATTPRTVTDIAHATGFCDASHLINMFRGAFGLSPAAFRRVGATGRDLTRPSSDVGDSFDEKLAEALYRA
ncbi:GlxA family transcriptional regulator [Tistrella mobilis]|uniref:AraC family transcriptional regulator n=1 Tax=Tistrella mobilis (strain KA081020-065) TaxID=1110502 RepID=I3TUV9_TISMK|nr:GlxA family transcriptional regulator [Tistrella mobilis]AFK56547.1 AraC family transcriptional regulator [Tistrella mobilis KA081020-065]